MPDRPIPLPRPLATPLSWIYHAGMAAHRALARARARAATLPIPVISIGNLSVGGTGKTPMVLHLARTLAAAGHHPCIAMRGYMPRTPRTKEPSAEADGPAVPPAASHPARDHNPALLPRSDEAASYHRALARLNLTIPIIAQTNRAAGIRALLAANPAIDCVLLDDGFQHHRLARTLDIVLIDASRSPFRDRLLPAGWLREPTTALRRAGAVVITHAEATDPHHLSELERLIARAHGKPPIAVTHHTWTALDITHPHAASDDTQPPSWLAGKRTLLVCAIGNPAPFQHAAAAAIGATPADTIILPDHDRYAPPTIARLLAAARSMDAILTTDKDWSKLSRVPRADWPCPIARPRLELCFTRGQTDLASLVLSTARSHPPAPGAPAN